MARKNGLEKMSYADLVRMEADIARMKIEKQAAERNAVRQKLTDIAAAAGFDINAVSYTHLTLPTTERV